MCVCVSMSQEGYRGIWCWGLAWEEKVDIKRPLSPLPFTTAAFDYWVAVSKKKKSLLLYFIVKNAEFFHQPNLTSAKDLTINVLEAVTFREREQCERWRCAMGNELNFLFCFSIVYFQLNEQCESLCVCVFVWDQISNCFPAEHRSYLNLQNALVASRCNGGRLKLLKLGIFHIK